ncbi:ABC transporter substrate-binding protein [Kribbella sp. CA-294648]|uniref:ABC transporter substrate-binding protein n=1 Tax=Kribbella sp. CA-294648 TaxID=3239948 RepID=UPI003D8D1FAB
MRFADRMLAVVAGICLGLSGCSGVNASETHISGQREVASASGKTVTIPAHPQRMVVDWITFDNLIGLDLNLATVAGIFGLDFFEKDPELSPFMTAKAREAGAKAMGEAFEPRYEALGAVKPDVIILAKDQTTDEVIKKLEEFAPVVVYDVPDGRKSFDDWRSSLRATAGVVDMAEAAEKYISSYDRRVADFKGQHPELVDLQATVGKIAADKVTVSMYKRNLGTNVVDELGLLRPALQRAHKVDAYQSFDVSLERLDLLDADVIFLEQRQAEATFLTRNPLWGRLKAVKTGRVYFVKNYWQSGAAGSAQHVLDDAIAALT